MSQELRQPVNLNPNQISCRAFARNAKPTEVRAAAVGFKQMRGYFGAGVPALDGQSIDRVFSLVPGETERTA
jgi:hypothetical protein